MSAWPLWLKRGEEGESKEQIFEQNVAAFQERSAAFREKTFFKRKKTKMYTFSGDERRALKHTNYTLHALMTRIFQSMDTVWHNIPKYGNNVAQIVTIFQSMDTMWHKL